MYLCVKYITRPYGSMLVDFEVSEVLSCRTSYILASQINLNQAVPGATPLFCAST